MLQKNLIVSVAMARTTAEFGGYSIANSKLPMLPRSLIVQDQMQSIQSRDVASVYILGRTKWGHRTTFDVR